MSNTQLAEQEVGGNELMQIQDTSQVVLNAQAMEQIYTYAKVMAGGKASLPKHLQGNVADCAAIIMQAMQWEMPVLSVAQKTFITPNGVMGYEAQLINAVITKRAPITGRPTYEFFGDWTKIQGKCKKIQPSGDKGAYFVADWKESDEVGLGVIVRCTLKGEDDPRELTLLLVQCQPRFSTQWATDPQQQITYAGIRKWSRRYVPDVIMGVYTDEELDYNPSSPKMKDVTPRNAVDAAEAAKNTTVNEDQVDKRAELIKTLTDIASKEGLLSYCEAWNGIGKTGRNLVGANEHAHMKALAEAYDQTHPPIEQTATQAPVDVEFVEQMNAAEQSAGGNHA